MRGNHLSIRLPGLVLFLIAPLVGEVLPGARSILSMLNPINFIVLTTLYGCGAVIIRETALRWKKGWPTIFLLGLAYGLVEEGIGAQSFANPSWGGLSVPSVYGRILGVNWVWVTQILLYHAFISISLSILIVAFLFPNRRGTQYVSNKTLVACIVGISLNLIFEVAILFSYNAGLFYYLGVILSIIVFVLLALRAPGRIITGRKIELSGLIIATLAFLFNLVYFAIVEEYIPMHFSPVLDLLSTLCLAILIFLFLILVKTGSEFEMLFYAAAGTIVYYSISSTIFNPTDALSAIFFIVILLVGRFRLARCKYNSKESSISI